MVGELSAERVTLRVLEHLERRRAAIVDDRAQVDQALAEALVPLQKEYEEAELPRAYWDGLQAEIRAVVPAAWQAAAQPFSALERRDFRLWRGGDLVARLTYVLSGLLLGGLLLWAPFIPIWEKWFPFVLAGAGWWLPDGQVRWHRRRYARALGRIALSVARTAPELEGRVSTEQLLLKDEGDRRE